MVTKIPCQQSFFALVPLDLVDELFDSLPGNQWQIPNPSGFQEGNHLGAATQQGLAHLLDHFLVGIIEQAYHGLQFTFGGEGVGFGHALRRISFNGKGIPKFPGTYLSPNFIHRNQCSKD